MITHHGHRVDVTDEAVTQDDGKTRSGKCLFVRILAERLQHVFEHGLRAPSFLGTLADLLVPFMAVRVVPLKYRSPGL